MLDGTTIYFYAPYSYGKARMNINFFEKKLKVSATTRNWNTVNKLAKMSGVVGKRASPDLEG